MRVKMGALDTLHRSQWQVTAPYTDLSDKLRTSYTKLSDKLWTPYTDFSDNRHKDFGVNVKQAGAELCQAQQNASYQLTVAGYYDVITFSYFLSKLLIKLPDYLVSYLLI